MLQTENLEQWVADLFTAIDKMDANGFVEYFTPDGAFVFGNAPPVEGKEAIEKAVSDFFQAIKGLSHQITGSWQVDDVIVVEGKVTYTRHNDTQITLPFADIFRMKDGLIADYRIYMDISPLFSE